MSVDIQRAMDALTVQDRQAIASEAPHSPAIAAIRKASKVMADREQTMIDGDPDISPSAGRNHVLSRIGRRNGLEFIENLILACRQ